MVQRCNTMDSDLTGGDWIMISSSRLIQSGRGPVRAANCGETESSGWSLAGPCFPIQGANDYQLQAAGEFKKSFLLKFSTFISQEERLIWIRRIGAEHQPDVKA